MALSATVYSFESNLTDVDRNVYQALAFRAAKHPSESDAYLMTRVLAYCVEFREGLSFSKGGLSEPTVGFTPISVTPRRLFPSIRTADA